MFYNFKKAKKNINVIFGELKKLRKRGFDVLNIEKAQ